MASVCQRPLCAKGAGSEADWGIVNGKATTDVRIIGAVGNPSARAGHLIFALRAALRAVALRNAPAGAAFAQGRQGCGANPEEAPCRGGYQPPASADPDRRKREADCLPYSGDFHK